MFFLTEPLFPQCLVHKNNGNNTDVDPQLTFFADLSFYIWVNCYIVAKKIRVYRKNRHTRIFVSSNLQLLLGTHICIYVLNIVVLLETLNNLVDCSTLLIVDVLEVVGDTCELTACNLESLLLEPLLYCAE